MMNLKNKISTLFRPFRNRKRQKYYLKKYGIIKGDYIILSNNCIGGMCYHDAAKEFLSPTINMCIDNFLTFVLNVQTYVTCKIEQVNDCECNYPVGLLKPNNGLPEIKVYFVHYDSFIEAEKKWQERSKRMLSRSGKVCVIYSVPVSQPFDDEEIKKFLEINAYRKLCFYREDKFTLPENTDSVHFVKIPKRYQSIDYSKYIGLFSRKRYFDKFFDIFGFLFK